MTIEQIERVKYLTEELYELEETYRDNIEALAKYLNKDLSLTVYVELDESLKEPEKEEDENDLHSILRAHPMFRGVMVAHESEEDEVDLIIEFKEVLSTKFLVMMETLISDRIKAIKKELKELGVKV